MEPRDEHLRLIAVFGSIYISFLDLLTEFESQKIPENKKINKINKRPTETSKTAKTPQGAAMSGSVFFMACFEALLGHKHHQSLITDVHSMEALDY